MKLLTVKHTTVYRYAEPVTFGDHRLMFRPRDSHDLRLLRTDLIISPPAQVRWLHDVFSNSVAIASFEGVASELRFESTIDIEHYGIEGASFAIEPYAEIYPFSYSADEAPDLVRLVERHHADPEHQVDLWARKFINQNGPTKTRDLLVNMTHAIKGELTYQARDADGTQEPVDTLTTKTGSCRDYALLMMEACRSLGFAARFVSGYLYDPALDGADEGTVGGGATHAWVQVYVPGGGWIELDPTNGLIGGTNLIRVAVTREPSQAIPLSGSFTGPTTAFLGMTVDVRVHRAAGRPSGAS